MGSKSLSNLGTIDLSRNKALQSIERAFHYLEQKGIKLKINNIAGTPVVETTDARTIFTFLWTLLPEDYLHYPAQLTSVSGFHDIRSVIQHITSVPFFYDFEKEPADLRNIYNAYNIAFVYYGKPHTPEYAKKKLEEEQIHPLLQSMDEKTKQNLWILRADNPIFRGALSVSSINESITNLIAALYFESLGYAVRSDIGSGPDLIAFRIEEIEELRKKRLFDSGLVQQLRLVKTFGRIEEPVEEKLSFDEEILAVETESWNPQNGIEQLKGHSREKKNFVDHWFADHTNSTSKPFDRAILALPSFNRKVHDVDVLYYDDDGIHWNRSASENYATRVQHEQTVGLNYLGSMLKQELCGFIPVREIAPLSELSLSPLWSLQKKMAEFIDELNLSKAVALFDDMVG